MKSLMGAQYTGSFVCQVDENCSLSKLMCPKNYMKLHIPNTQGLSFKFIVVHIDQLDSEPMVIE